MIRNQNSNISKKATPAEAFIRISRYCAFQERSHHEVRNKLFEYGLYTSEVEETLSRLITDGFLNEERFAKAFVGGKFRMKKWGRNKIEHELEAHQLTPRCIQIGLKEIDNGDYKKTLTGLLKKKLTALEEPNRYTKRDKAARFVIAKGYEPELVWSILKEITAV